MLPICYRRKISGIIIGDHENCAEALSISGRMLFTRSIAMGSFLPFARSEIDPDRVDVRFDSDQQDDFEPFVPDDYGYITSDEAIRVGLPSNPQWDAIFEDEGGIPDDPTEIETLIALKIVEADDDKVQRGLIKANENKQKQDDWDEKYDQYIEIIEAKLFVALREKTLEAFGRKIPVEDDDVTTYTDYEHELIPSEYWRQSAIAWGQSALETGKYRYCHIFVKTEQLFKIFPMPEASPAKAVKVVADQYILDEEFPEKIVKKSGRGRPSNDWGGFYIEIMSLLKQGNLPDKQEAFISEMQNWCKMNWGHEIGRSTLLEKISPIYNKFKRS